jgi:Zn-dependent protease with chaperone function
MKVKRHFKDISPKTWEHPADRAALIALKQVPGFTELLRQIISLTTEKSLRLIFLSNSVRVSERQFPKVQALAREASAVLDLQKLPEVYVSQDPVMNATTLGVKNPFVIVNSSLVESLSEEELLAVLGHEMGHCASGHALYKTFLWLLVNIGMLALRFPGAGLVILAVTAALREWDRKSELSADRAGVLAVQHPSTSYELLMKLAGGGSVGEMNIDEFFSQAAEYEGGGDILDSVYKLLNLMGRSHPFAVLRLSELKTWIDSGSYEAVLSGQYRTREKETPEDVMKELGEASRQYREDLLKSKDPLAQVFAKIGKNLESFSKQSEDFFKSIFPGS